MSEDGVKLGSSVALVDSWIHDLVSVEGSHNDGAQMQTGARDVLVQGNVIDVSGSDGAPSGNAAIFLSPDLGPSSPGPVTIVGNVLDGGNYILYCVDGAQGQYVVSNITIAQNRFGRMFRYGPSRISVPVDQDGNVWDDTDEELQL